MPITDCQMIIKKLILGISDCSWRIVSIPLEVKFDFNKRSIRDIDG